MRLACFLLLALFVISPALLGDGESVEPKAKPRVAIKLQVFELSAKRLKERGNKIQEAQNQLAALLPKKPAEGKSVEAFELKLCDAADAAQLFQQLHREGVAKLLAEPMLVTIAGRPTAYFSGGEVRAPGDPNDKNPKSTVRRYGTELNCLPQLLDNGRLQLEFRARVSQLDPSLDLVIKGERYPGIRCVEVDTGFNLEFGQTAVIGGLTQIRNMPKTEKDRPAEGNRDEIMTVFLVTPELIPAVARFPAPVPNAHEESPGKAGG